MYRVACTISLLVAGLAGCGSLPDIGRAEQTAAAGNVAEARAQLEELARFGLPEAQVELGDLYADEDSDESRKQALAWYRKAEAQGSKRASLRLGKMFARDGRTAKERAYGARYLRRALAAGDDSAVIPLVNLYLEYPQEFPNEDPVALIERARAAGDPAGDYALARYYVLSGQGEQRAGDIEALCTPIAEAQPKCFQLLAGVYLSQQRDDEFRALVQRAQGAWESGQLEDRDLYLFARWLSGDESPRAQVGTTNELYLQLTPDYVPALTARARLIMEHNYLANPEAVIEMLEEARAKGDQKATLALARAYERGRIVPAQPDKAIELAKEVRERYPSADYLLGRIYKKGYLGEADPEQALHYLLKAARRGFPKADYALAEMYWEGKGLAVNRQYAWSFAMLALAGGVERARDLMKEMLPSLPRHVELAAEELFRQERAARRQMLASRTGKSATTDSQGG